MTSRRTTTRMKPPSGAARAAASQDSLRLQAVRTRNATFDGEFYYGVRTTHVFCVPSCPSRQARPENLVFFDSPTEAQAAGYRACRRCQPLRRSAASPAQAAVRAVCAYIDAHADEPLSLARLAGISGYSDAHLQRTFKAQVGISPKEYQSALRVTALKRALRAGDGIAQATYAAGYGSASRLHALADGRLGMTPSAYRAGGAGETIAYAYGETVLGPLLMAATDRGVCFAQFGDNAAALARELAAEFPRATLVRSGAEHAPELEAWLRAVNAHLAGATPRPDLPLDVRGTAFQVRVWQCLMGIREGEVLSYGELATRLRSPSATRAVASACARNRIAVLIPCHRVLRSDGTLGGYRWGLERKRALLDAERGRTRSVPPAS